MEPADGCGHWPEPQSVGRTGQGEGTEGRRELRAGWQKAEEGWRNQACGVSGAMAVPGIINL